MEAGAPGGAPASDSLGVFAARYSAEPFTPVRKRPAAAAAPHSSDNEEVSPECAFIAAFVSLRREPRARKNSRITKNCPSLASR